MCHFSLRTLIGFLPVTGAGEDTISLLHNAYLLAALHDILNFIYKKYSLIVRLLIMIV